MVTVYITRHGETEYNTVNRVQGWCDSPLTDTGIKNAEALSRRLQNIHIDAVYTSPLKRAKDTAKILRGQKNIPIIDEPGFKELGFGRLERHTYSEFPKIIGFDHDYFFKNLGKISKNAASLYGGENYESFSSRVKDALFSVLHQNEGKSVLIVSHTMPVQFILALAGGLGGENFGEIPKPHQTSFTKIIYNGGQFFRETVDDISHYE